MKHHYVEKLGVTIYEDGKIFYKNKEVNVFIAKVSNRQYRMFSLHGKVYYLHRVLAESFIKKPSNAKYVKFKDNDSLNISLDNMHWANSAKKKSNKSKLKKSSSAETSTQKISKKEEAQKSTKNVKSNLVELPKVAQIWLDFCREHKLSISQSFLVQAGVPLPGQQDFQDWIKKGNLFENEELFAYAWLHGSYTAEEMMEDSVSQYIQNCKKQNIPFLDAISKEMAGDTIYTWFLSNSDQFVSIWGV